MTILLNQLTPEPVSWAQAPIHLVYLSLSQLFDPPFILFQL